MSSQKVTTVIQYSSTLHSHITQTVHLCSNCSLFFAKWYFFPLHVFYCLKELVRVCLFFPKSEDTTPKQHFPDEDNLKEMSVLIDHASAWGLFQIDQFEQMYGKEQLLEAYYWQISYVLTAVLCKKDILKKLKHCVQLITQK